MKKMLSVGLVMVIVLMFAAIGVAMAGPAEAQAADQLLEAKISSVSTQLDKNGREYTRLIVEVNRNIQGVKYDVGVPAMAFGALNDEAKKLKAGDTLKCIANEREYQGRSSFTIIKMLTAAKTAKK